MIRSSAEERAHEVCRYVVDVLKGEGANLDGTLCPHATPSSGIAKELGRAGAKVVVNYAGNREGYASLN